MTYNKQSATCTVEKQKNNTETQDITTTSWHNIESANNMDMNPSHPPTVQRKPMSGLRFESRGIVCGGNVCDVAKEAK